MKHIILSKKGKKEFPKWEKVWKAGQHAVKELLAENEQFIPSLTLFEDANNHMPFKERASIHLH